MTSAHEDSSRILKAPEYAKAIGIVLVVFGHALRGLIAADVMPSSSFWDTVDKGIYLFHMPLFFYLSGLFIRDNFKKAGGVGLVKKYAALLLVPLVIWSYLQFSLQYLAASSVNHSQDLTDVLLAPFPPSQQFWFLGSLFISVVLIALIFYARNFRAVIAGILVTYMIISCFLPEGGLNPFMLGNKWMSLLGQTYLHFPYVLLGILVGPAVIRSVSVGTIPCLIVFSASIFFYLISDNAPDIVRFLASIACVLTLYKFFDILSLKFSDGALSRTLVFVGLNSMIIYLAHVIASAGTRAILLKLGINDPSVHLTAGTAMGILAPLTLVMPSLYIGRKLPFFSKYIVPAKIERN